MKDLFGNMFDYNKNGKIDPEEIAAEYIYLSKLANISDRPDNEDNDPFGLDDDIDEFNDDEDSENFDDSI